MRALLLRVVPTACAVAILLGWSGACYDRDDYVVSPQFVDKALTLTLSRPDSTLPADGFSRITIAAHVDPSADADRRTVVFSTTAGTLIGGTVSGSAQEVTTGANGIASIDLQSTTQVQTIRVRAEVKGQAGIAQVVEIRLRPVAGDSVIRFAAVPDSMPADGATIRTLSVEIASAIPAGQRTVKFTTTAGTFVANNGTTIDVIPDAATNRASVELRSATQATIARVQVQAATFQRDTALPFVRALPDTVLVDPGKFAMTSREETVVRARLLRSVGTVTPGINVFFTAVDSVSGTEVGQWRSVQPVGSNGEATAVFQPVGVISRRTIIIRATVERSNKQGTARIVVDP